MTSETKTTIEAVDVKAIELQCVKCGIRVSHSIERWNIEFHKCPNCNSGWEMEHQKLFVAVRDMVLGLRLLADPKQSEGNPFRIRLEIVEPKKP